jgi:NADH-ubiquinone oxidoreductase chain 5
MIILVTGNNLLILFLGWEGVGLCSYLLINFWYTRINANKSAMKALIINRIGDFGLMLGLAIIYYTIGSLDFSVIFSIAPIYFMKPIYFLGCTIYIGTLIGFLLFIAAMGKSAQIILHTWLPDAMEGPTPVSALIHAATMVTAGVFLIIKCSPLFEYITTILNLMVFVGALTCFFSATIGLVQNDIKKVIAYSTCSQLGYMIFICGLSQYNASFYHLSNHAFFKALLFLSAGGIIHTLANEQDMRKFGGLNILLPITSMAITIGSLALAGIPFLSGFYSKDLIIELAFSKYTLSSTFVYIMGVITAVLTSIYSYKIFFLTFLTTPNFSKPILFKIHESPILIVFTFIFLSISSILVGFFSKDFFVGLGSDFWGQTIYIHPKNNIQVDSEFIPQIFKILPFCLSLFFVFIFNLINEWNIVFCNNFVKKIHLFFSYKWYFDYIYNKLIAYQILKLAYVITYKAIDKGLLEIIGPTGFILNFFKLTYNIKQVHYGRIYLYGHFTITFVIILLIIYTFF